MSRTEKARRGTLALVGEISEAELAVRMIEAVGGYKRPPGLSAAAILDDRTPADVRAVVLRQARAALAYFAECVANGTAPQ